MGVMVVFLWLSFRSCLYILICKYFLPDCYLSLCSLNHVSQRVDIFCFFLVQCVSFFFHVSCFWYLRNFCLTQGCNDFSPMFLLWVLLFWVSHLGSILQGMDHSYFFVCAYLIVPVHLLKILSVLCWTAFALCPKSFFFICVGFISGLSILFHGVVKSWPRLCDWTTLRLNNSGNNAGIVLSWWLLLHVNNSWNQVKLILQLCSFSKFLF